MIRGITYAIDDGEMVCAVGNEMPGGISCAVYKHHLTLIFIRNPTICVTEMAEPPCL